MDILPKNYTTDSDLSPSRKKINYVSNLSLQRTSGGWGGINHKIYTELEKYFDVHFAGPISPDSFFWEKLLSKALRMTGQKGKFHFFSEKRLRKIAELVKEQISSDADYHFFFGATPWINVAPTTPYAVYLDADFLTYMEIFSTVQQFQHKDLERIAQKEAEWLENADHIFWGSNWAKQQLQKQYPLKNQSMTTVWTGGYIDIPDQDRYKGELLFTFISLNFEKKGGPVCVEAFKKIRAKHPEAQLMILGQQPPAEVLENPGVQYGGYLRKTKPEEYAEFKSIIERSFLMIHPTKMDTMGAVIIESGYYGCPTIAPRRFGIPELIKDQKTGMLVDVPFSEDDFADPILKLMEDENQYAQMRKAVREHTISNLSWESIGKRISSQISSNL